jgi:hypothetical protein
MTDQVTVVPGHTAAVVANEPDSEFPDWLKVSGPKLLSVEPLPTANCQLPAALPQAPIGVGGGGAVIRLTNAALQRLLLPPLASIIQASTFVTPKPTDVELRLKLQFPFPLFVGVIVPTFAPLEFCKRICNCAEFAPVT